MAGERHGNGMLYVNPPKECCILMKLVYSTRTALLVHVSGPTLISDFVTQVKKIKKKIEGLVKIKVKLLLSMPYRRTGGLGCRATHFQYPHFLEIGSQFHASAALPPGRKKGSYQLKRRLDFKLSPFSECCMLSSG
jgi:hypothetical protein